MSLVTAGPRRPSPSAPLPCVDCAPPPSLHAPPPPPRLLPAAGRGPALPSCSASLSRVWGRLCCAACVLHPSEAPVPANPKRELCTQSRCGQPAPSHNGQMSPPPPPLPHQTRPRHSTAAGREHRADTGQTRWGRRLYVPHVQTSAPPCWAQPLHCPLLCPSSHSFAPMRQHNAVRRHGSGWLP
jgi:hypothetical protein